MLPGNSRFDPPEPIGTAHAAGSGLSTIVFRRIVGPGVRPAAGAVGRPDRGTSVQAPDSVDVHVPSTGAACGASIVVATVNVVACARAGVPGRAAADVVTTLAASAVASSRTAFRGTSVSDNLRRTRP